MSLSLHQTPSRTTLLVCLGSSMVTSQMTCSHPMVNFCQTHQRRRQYFTTLVNYGESRRKNPCSTTGRALLTRHMHAQASIHSSLKMYCLR
ncbi:hypothetical protein NP493_7g08008 [Ridgeia piscesae]|uniref:Uncharacterized protein n=1 Tax=Ridgeia piscesae TaxID=27915 RepID=A0AAD9PFT9_RIDPI|nr:hypothetical protein NP493_7g08008 [Ridgeia piscesae]